ncbi:MAG: LPS export ABC transporter periplasmic protein LptC [Bacteroidota bacterium]
MMSPLNTAGLCSTLRRFFFGGIAIALLGLAACEEIKKETRQVFSEEDTAIEVGKDVEILYSDSAIVRVRVTGPVLYNRLDRDDPRQEFPQGVKIEFLLPNQGVRSTLTAKTATRRQEKGEIIARDSVIMTTIEQERLETEELIWDEKTAKVYTEKFVKVTKPGEIIYGYGLEADQDFSYWKIKVPKGRIKIDKIDDSVK